MESYQTLLLLLEQSGEGCSVVGACRKGFVSPNCPSTVMTAHDNNECLLCARPFPTHFRMPLCGRYLSSPFCR